MREQYQGPPLFLTVSLSWLTIRILVLERSHYFLFCCVLAIKDGRYIDFRKGNIKYVKSQSGSFPPRRFNTSACCLLLHLFTLSCYLSEAMLRMCRNLAQTFPWLKFSLVLTCPFVVFICICKTVFLEMFNRVVIFQIELCSYQMCQWHQFKNMKWCNFKSKKA